MDLVREILLRVEKLDVGNRLLSTELEDRNPAEVAEHMHLLVSAGLAEGTVKARFHGAPFALLRALTWQGHEFVAATRNAGVWQRVKAKAAEHGGALPFTVLAELAATLARKQLGLGDGG